MPPIARRSFLACPGGLLLAQSAPPQAKIVSSVALRSLPGSFEEKLAAVARAGIQSVQISGEERDVPRVRSLIRSYTLSVDTVEAGAELTASIDFARILEARLLLLPPSLAVDSLRRAGDLAAKAELTVLARSLQAVKEADHQHVRLLYDTFEQHAQSGDAVKALAVAAPFIKLIHVADSPGRGEPGTGSIAFDAFYREAAKLGFEGPIAMAFQPKGETAASLIRAVDAMRRSLSAPPAKA